MAGRASEAMMNKATAEQPKSGHRAPGGKTSGSPVGKTTPADMRGAQEGNPTDHNPLRGAVEELGRQHPHAYTDHGPHHGTSEHIRHMPLHGMKPTGK